MKKSKKILAAIDAAKAEILAAITEKKAAKPDDKKEPTKKKKKERSPLQDHFVSLRDMLDGTEPNRYKIMTVVAPLIDALEKEDGITEGLMDVLSPSARKSVLMLFLFHMLKDADQQKPGDLPDKVPLDISEGDNIPQRVVDGQVPYKRRPQQKLDRGF